jgi:regulator of protease activity HflC (stomatin/prohibitin superfamily)
MARFAIRRNFTVMEYERGLLYVDGRFVRLLEPGRYSFWRWENAQVTKVSLRQMSEVLTGQEILTSDKVEVRVSVIVQYIVSDPPLAINSVESYRDSLHQEVQLALRQAITARTIEQLLEARAEMGDELLTSISPAALVYGVTVRRIGVRDIVLPGSMRSVMLKEVEADRQGRAELVKARHEVAAARARANTAKILSENPNVARLQEIDALIQLAGKEGSVVVLPNLADLLIPRKVDTDDSK